MTSRLLLVVQVAVIIENVDQGQEEVTETRVHHQMKGGDKNHLKLRKNIMNMVLIYSLHFCLEQEHHFLIYLNHQHKKQRKVRVRRKFNRFLW